MPVDGGAKGTSRSTYVATATSRSPFIISRYCLATLGSDVPVNSRKLFAPRAQRPSSPRSYHTVPSLPSLLSALAIEEGTAAAAASAFVLLRACDKVPRSSSPWSYRTVPSLLSTLAIEDAAVAAATTAIVLLRGQGRGVSHMMHASPRSFSFTMVQAPHSHDDDMMLE